MKEWITYQLKNIRFYIMLFSVLLAGFVFWWVKSLSTLIQTYALISITYLYFTLLVSPFTLLFSKFPYKALCIHARRALGVSVFFFASLHVYFAFFVGMGGFAGIGFLTGIYLWAALAGFTALLILSLLASTSFDYMVRKLGTKWKKLHKLVYLVGILILFHALIFGTHFQNPFSIISIVFWIALTVLLIMEGIRIYRYLQRKHSTAIPHKTP